MNLSPVTDLNASDEFYDTSQWGVGARDYLRLLLDPNKNRLQRRRLFLFFWANGMHPDRAYYYVLWHHFHNYRRVDSNGINSLNDVRRTVDRYSRSGQSRLVLLPSERIWDIEEQRPIGRRDLAILDFRDF
jgi:hypothetical protein